MSKLEKKPVDKNKAKSNSVHAYLHVLGTFGDTLLTFSNVLVQAER